jgi:FKBP-type peptidyl-prolyl cis-trans isomerase SlyD
MIEAGSRVSIEYTLRLDDGSVADSNVGGPPLVYEQGRGQILPALEARLGEMAVDDTGQVTLSPEEGYGPVHPELFETVRPDVLPEEARKVGAALVSEDESGQKRHLKVHEIHDEGIVLDFNHQLAGERLHFDVRVLAIE